MKYPYLSPVSFSPQTNPVKVRHTYRGVGGSLAELFRTIQYDLGISGPRMEVLISEFIINEKRNLPDNRVARFLVRGNIRRELERSSMTFKVFVKMLKIIGVKRMNFGVEIDFGNSAPIQKHSVFVDLKNHSGKSIDEDGGQSVSAVMSHLWNHIREAQGYTTEQFDNLLSEFISSERKRIKDKRIAKLFTKGNVKRELEKPTMTFKVFIKGLRVISVKHVKVFVNIERSSAQKDKVHYFTQVNFNSETDFDENDNDEPS
jgi:hypothetical protein